MTNKEKLITMTLTIDSERHRKLKETARVTRVSMSEITRIALDRLWNDLGDLKNPSPEAVKILFSQII